MQRCHSLALAGLTGMGIATGCTSSSPSPAGAEGTSSVTASQACFDLAHERCTRIEACSPLRLQVTYGTQATCEAVYSETCVNALSAPSSGNSPADTEQCAQATAGWSCTDFLDDANTPAACLQRTGALANGASCAFAGQCSSGFCAVSPDAQCGTCAVTPKAGDSCAQLQSCGQGLICTGDTKTCVTFARQGAACGAGAPCGTGLSCVGADPVAGKMGACQQAVGQQGGACDPLQQTAAGCNRDGSLACNQKSGQCLPITIASTGQPCGDVDGQAAACGAAGVCAGATAAQPGKCLAPSIGGDACNTVTGPGCLPLSHCIVGGPSLAILGVDAGPGTDGVCLPPTAARCH